MSQIVKKDKDIDDGRGVKREDLAQQQPTHHDDAQRFAQLGTVTGSQRQRQPSQQRRHGGHHNWAEAEQASIVNCIRRVLAVLPLAFQGEVDHHDAVLFHNADQQDNADDRNHVDGGEKGYQFGGLKWATCVVTQWTSPTSPQPLDSSLVALR
jgi:hypothetical protein